ncbi:MAG: hypothetical protein ACOX21_07985 [Bacillota bacterium]|jgi:hypothetical protein
MKRLSVLGICFLLISVTCIAGCSWQNTDEQKITYLIDFPVPGEPLPKITGATFSPNIDFSQLNTPLPIYEVSAAMYSEDELKTLGETFDFRFEDVSRNEQFCHWYAQPGHYLTVFGASCFIYQKEPENVDPTKPFPDDEVLRQAAEEFLKKNNLMPEGFVYSFVADGVVAEFGSGERYVESRTVSFTRYIDNVPVYGNSRLAVSFDRELNITAVDSIYRPIVAQLDAPPARDARKMLELAVKKGRGLFGFDLEKESPQVTLHVTEVRQTYWEDEEADCIYPVFHYTGDVYNKKGENIGKFVAMEQSF